MKEKKITKKELFIKKCKNKFGLKFTYDEYVNSQTKINILCNEHNILFNQTPSEHLRGKNGCKSCQKSKNKKVTMIKLPKNKNKILGNDKFIEKALIVHGDKYGYSLVDYKKSDINIKIICTEHGVFEQLPYSHLRGKGCEKCGKLKTKNVLSSNTCDFTNKAKLVHGDKYGYSLVDYKNSQTKVKIICSKHKVFEQLPYDHLSGHGCNKCSSSISKVEYEINDFILSLNLSTITSLMSIIKPNQLDIYVPSHKLAIEYNGLYWHSEEFLNNNYHLNKTEICEKNDIKLIHIFEDEWLLKKNIVKSRIINLLGLTQNKIYGRKCEIKLVSINESKKFLNENHIQGELNSSINMGLFFKDEMVSLMCFNKPRLGIGSSYDGYELSRFCNKLNTIVVGGADKLLKHFIKTNKPKQIISYADRRWSQGDLYEKLGFIKSHINKPNYSYVIGKNRKNRFGFRKEILKKEGFDTANKTERQIMVDRGIYRIYDCGTISYKLCCF